VRGIVRLSVVALPLLLVTASTAIAANTASEAYGGPAGGVQNVAAGAVGGSSLPFTGTNLVLLVVVGLGLVLTGLMLRRTKSAE
jgi:hypothetical protein